MKLKKTPIEDAYLLKPEILRDERGFFFESWNSPKLIHAGFEGHFLQGNCSRTLRNVIRGLHFQRGDSSQAKMVWVTSGAVFDVIVDLRRNSSSFGNWFGIILEAKTKVRLWVPRGCAHGFLAITKFADVYYNLTSPYAPADQLTLQWDDPDLAISWPLVEGAQPILSSKDRQGLSFEDCPKF